MDAKPSESKTQFYTRAAEGSPLGPPEAPTSPKGVWPTPEFKLRFVLTSRQPLAQHNCPQPCTVKTSELGKNVGRQDLLREQLCLLHILLLLLRVRGPPLFTQLARRGPRAIPTQRRLFYINQYGFQTASSSTESSDSAPKNGRQTTRTARPSPPLPNPCQRHGELQEQGIAPSARAWRCASSLGE